MRYLTVILILLVASQAVAGTSVMQRTDVIGSGDPSYTLGIFTASGLEFWGLGLPDYPDYEIGKTWAVASLSSKERQVYFSAYAVVWPEANPDAQYFLLPWPSVCIRKRNVEIKADLYAYLPMNGGPICFGTSDTGITWPAGKGRLGISATHWKQEGCEASSGIGIAGSCPIGKTTISGRYIPKALGSDEAFRLQMNYAF